MKPFTNPLPKPPPSKQRPFDPYNSSSTGHQRREAPRQETDGVSETDWRTSRTIKINQQFKTQSHSTTLANAPPPPLQQQKSVMEMLVKPGSMKDALPSKMPADEKKIGGEEEKETGAKRKKKMMFDGLVMYVNGSTFPLISDHTLKKVLAEHGARIALHLARRQVTHVILGRPAGGGGGGGCGGGLSGTKMDKEIRRIGGHGIKYVGVEWVLESIRAGRRLSEARFSNLKIAAEGQSSVYNLSKMPTP